MLFIASSQDDTQHVCCHIALRAAWHDMAQWLLSFYMFEDFKRMLGCFHLLPQPNKAVISKSYSPVKEPKLTTEPNICGDYC